MRRDVSSPIEKRNFESRDRTPGDVIQDEMHYHAMGVNNVNTTYIQKMHKIFAKEPHLAGTQRNTELGQFMVSEWKQFGFDRVEAKEYDVLLSYPRSPANISLKDENGKIIHQLTTTEEAFYPEENSTDSVYPFNAYSNSGDVEAEYVFINFGDVKDHMWLADHMVSVGGKICIAKYGATFRGEKARLAFLYGCVGLLLYGDPEDFNKGGGGYPKTWDLPPGAIPRGNILNVKGDPLTRLYPAREGMYRRKVEEADYLSKIPVQPISYMDAKVLLESMDGDVVPDPDWQGGMNFTYRITSKTKRKIRMIIDTPKERRKIQNIVGTIKGEVEPDRIVLIGNHRDAWVYGAGDPSSGTACLMEVARTMSTMLKGGWRPRRTIMLVSWDAEEYGLMGSAEWVQDYGAVLGSRGIAYINVDIGVSGNYSIRAKSSPQLADKLFEVAKTFPDPDHNIFEETKNSLYDAWVHKFPSNKIAGEPVVRRLGSGSDFTKFYATLGMAAVDLRYTFDETTGLTQYPSYHTIYDNLQYYNRFVDPDYRYHTVVTKMLLQVTLGIADDFIIPFNITRYCSQIVNDTDAFEYSYMEMMAPKNVTMEPVRKAALSLLKAAQEFQKRLNDVNKNSCLEVRRFNDQLMQFERAFIVPEGLPQLLADSKHILYSPYRKTLFKGGAFPSLSSLLYDIQLFEKDYWGKVQEVISQIVFAINNAEQVISDFAQI